MSLKAPASAWRGLYPRVRRAPAGEEWAAAPVKEKRREKGGLKVCEGGRYSPTSLRRSTESLLQALGVASVRSTSGADGGKARAQLGSTGRRRALGVSAGASV